jgi:hypothetical protein
MNLWRFNGFYCIVIRVDFANDEWYNKCPDEQSVNIEIWPVNIGISEVLIRISSAINVSSNDRMTIDKYVQLFNDIEHTDHHQTQVSSHVTCMNSAQSQISSWGMHEFCPKSYFKFRQIYLTLKSSLNLKSDSSKWFQAETDISVRFISETKFSHHSVDLTGPWTAAEDDIPGEEAAGDSQTR